MAIQNRRGNEADFDPAKMLPGEWAVSLDTRYVRMCFAPGIVLRMATYEAFEADMEQIKAILAEAKTVEEAIEKIYNDVQQVVIDIETASEAAQTAIEKSEEAVASANDAKSYAANAKTSETNAKTSEANAKASETSASSSATSASTSASNAKASANTANTHATTASEKASAASTSANTATIKANAAADSALLSESYAHGGTGTREGEDTDNSKYFYEGSKEIYKNFQSAGNITGVKGDKETEYRTGQVNLTPEDIGALPSDGNAVSATKATQDENGKVIADTYLPLTGGTLTGALTGTSINSIGGMKAEGGFCSKFIYTDSQPSAYTKVAQIVIKRGWQDGLFEIIVHQSKQSVVGKVTIGFPSSSSTDPSLGTFTKTGDVDAYIVKSATSTWDLYLKDRDTYEGYALTLLRGYDTIYNSFTWQSEAVSSLPDGYIKANNLDGETVWKNASPTSEFSATTISISGSGYSKYEILYYVDNDASILKSTGILPLGKPSILEYFTISNDVQALFKREAYVTINEIFFEDAFIYKLTNGNYVEYPTNLIPYQVILYP